MPDFPLVWANGNLLVGLKGTRGAMYRTEVCSYPYLPESDQRRWLGRQAKLAYGMQADFSVYRVNRAYPHSRYTGQAMTFLDKRSGDVLAWEAYVGGHSRQIRSLRAHSPEVYVIKRLATPGVNLRVGRRKDDAEIMTGFQGLKQQERRARRHVDTCFPGMSREIETKELQWLIRRVSCLGEPEIDEYWEPPAMEVEMPNGEVGYRPLRGAVERCGDDPVYVRPRYLEVEGQDGTNYQAMLVLGHLPEETMFPGDAEMLYRPLESLRFPVDAVVHCRWISNAEALSLVTKRIVDADNAADASRTSQAGSLSYKSEENSVRARALEAYLRSPERPPLLHATVGFAVRGARTPEQLEHRVEQLKDRYPVMLHRPYGLQHALYLDHLPRPDGGTVRGYEQLMTIDQFGALMAVGTHDLGTTRGVYFAHTVGGQQRPLLDDFRAASREHRAAARFFCGTSGSGKTTAAELACIQAALAGDQIVNVDPGNDHRLEHVAELEGLIDVIDLDDPDKYAGALDPMVILPQARKIDGTYSYLMDVLPPDLPPAWKTAVRAAVAQVVKEVRYPGSNLVTQRLLSHPIGSIEREVGEALRTWSSDGLPRFGFSDGHSDGLRARNRGMTIRPSALQLPPAESSRESWDALEQLSVATYKLVANLAMALIDEDRTRGKTILIDEGHFFTATDAGRHTIEDLVRQGRKKNARLLFASQLVGDPQELAKLMGWVAVFGFDDAEEAALGARLLGLDPDDRELVEQIKSSRRGLCFIRDINGSVVRAQIDLVYDELREQLDTSPDAALRRVAEVAQGQAEAATAS